MPVLTLTVKEEVHYSIEVEVPDRVAAELLAEPRMIGIQDFAVGDFDEWLGGEIADTWIDSISDEYCRKRTETPHSFDGVYERDITSIELAPADTAGVPLPIDEEAIARYFGTDAEEEDNKDDDENH